MLGNEPGLVGNWRLDGDDFLETSGTYPAGETNGAKWDENSAAPIDISDGIVEEIPSTITSFDNSIIFVPDIEAKFLENVEITAEVKDIQDIYGNKSDSIAWKFYADQNPVSWEVAYLKLFKQPDENFTFSAKLINGGTDVERFWIQDLPYWLTVDYNEGTLSAFAEQEITFTVSPLLGKGDYTAIIHAKTKEGWEPLNIQLRVTCDPPSSEFSAANYEFSMTVTDGDTSFTCTTEFDVYVIPTCSLSIDDEDGIVVL